jgi:hypothetical protein
VLVDVETVRYGVPYHLVREPVEVAVGDETVRIFHGATLVATHRRVREPYARVLEPRMSPASGAARGWILLMAGLTVFSASRSCTPGAVWPEWRSEYNLARQRSGLP